MRKTFKGAYLQMRDTLDFHIRLHRQLLDRDAGTTLAWLTSLASMSTELKMFFSATDRESDLQASARPKKYHKRDSSPQNSSCRTRKY